MPGILLFKMAASPNAGMTASGTTMMQNKNVLRSEIQKSLSAAPIR